MANETKTTGRDSDKFMLRFPPGMRQEITAAATKNNRTMNAEIVARLEGSFDIIKSLPFTVQEAIEHEQEQRGGVPEEALLRLAQLALAQGGTLLNVTLAKGTTFKQFTDMLKASEQIVPPDAAIILERRE